MFVEAIKMNRTAIFPIFFRYPVGEQFCVGVSGTGFFVNDSGYFITANHVMTSLHQGNIFEYRGEPVDNPVVGNTIGITEVYRDVANDIYIGRIDTEIRQHVTLSRTKPDLGQSVCLSGYPLSKINATAAGMDISQVRRYWLMTNIMDFLNITQPGGVIIHKGFITEASTIEGMSGGPVFGVNGEVYGIAGAFFPREFIRADGTTKNISNGIIIDINNFLDVIDEHING